jgi:hypothetical protein
MATAFKYPPVRDSSVLKVVPVFLGQSNRGFENEEDTALYQQQRFTHHGLAFYIEAEGWRKENMARAAMATLRNWVTEHSSEETTQLFVVLMREREAIVRENEFDHQQAPLAAVRSAQHDVVRTAMEGQNNYQDWPLLILEAGVL